MGCASDFLIPLFGRKWLLCHCNRIDSLLGILFYLETAEQVKVNLTCRLTPNHNEELLVFDSAKSCEFRQPTEKKVVY